MTSRDRIDDVVDALLAAPAVEHVTGGQAALEALLTAGYARALELEAERLRAPDQRTAAALTDRVRSLRSRLDAIKRKYGAPGSSRHDDLDRGPGAGRRVDDELAS
jgi:hypothetical protein